MNISRGEFESGTRMEGEPVTFRAKALVAAAGGFESNLEWLEEVWARRHGIFSSAERRTTKGGFSSRCSKTAWIPLATRGSAMRSRLTPLAEVRRRHRYQAGFSSLGIVVNRNGRRFEEKQSPVGPKRYAVWGRHFGSPCNPARSGIQFRFEGAGPVHAFLVSRRAFPSLQPVSFCRWMRPCAR